MHNGRKSFKNNPVDDDEGVPDLEVSSDSWRCSHYCRTCRRISDPSTNPLRATKTDASGADDDDVDEKVPELMEAMSALDLLVIEIHRFGEGKQYKQAARRWNQTDAFFFVAPQPHAIFVGFVFLKRSCGDELGRVRTTERSANFKPALALCCQWCSVTNAATQFFLKVKRENTVHRTTFSCPIRG